MAKQFKLAEPEVVRQMVRIRDAHHSMLRDAEVVIAVLTCVELSKGGHAVAGQIRVVPPKDRVTKKVDAEMLLDRKTWERLSHGQQDALLDHELSHLQLRKASYSKDAEGRVELEYTTDDRGRPLLKLVPADWTAGDGFAAVCRRHGAAAMEFRNLAVCHGYATAAAAGEILEIEEAVV